ncbi:MAG: DUF4367 domain-containing protein [Anaerolineae bacterium]|nr:DUF4367 domain-containing protein [Anaerolineae bacterium]
MTDPMKDLFDNLNQSTPAPKNMAENKAVFLATAHRMNVTSEGDKRHQRVNAYITKGDLPMKLGFNRKRTTITVVVVAILMMAGAVLASGIFRFFRQSESNTDVITSRVGEMTHVPATFVPATIIGSLEFALSKPPYDAKAPTFLPEGYTFGQAIYDAQFEHYLSLGYKCKNGAFNIDQIPLPDGGYIVSSFEVGADGVIEVVDVGDGGEYVRGGWVRESDGRVVDHGAQYYFQIKDIPIVWSNDLNQILLIWKDGDMSYQLTASFADGECALSKEDILAIANSLE